MFKGKVAIVTGGAGGIGLEYVKELLRNDIEGVTIIDINSRNGKDIKEQLNHEFGRKVFFHQADVSQKHQLKAAFVSSFEYWNGLDIVINNAGICDEENWEKTISINCTGTAHGTFLGFEFMNKLKGGNGGVILNISSIAGVNTYPFLATYSGTKSFVISFSRALGNEVYHESSCVKVLTVCPGLTDTLIVPDITGNALNGFGPKLRHLATDIVGKTKLQTPQNVARHVMTLINDAQNGSVWVIEDDEPPFQIHDYKTSDLRIKPIKLNGIL